MNIDLKALAASGANPPSNPLLLNLNPRPRRREDSAPRPAPSTEPSRHGYRAYEPGRGPGSWLDAGRRARGERRFARRGARFARFARLAFNAPRDDNPKRAEEE